MSHSKSWRHTHTHVCDTKICYKSPYLWLLWAKLAQKFSTCYWGVPIRRPESLSVMQGATADICTAFRPRRSILVLSLASLVKCVGERAASKIHAPRDWFKHAHRKQQLLRLQRRGWLKETGWYLGKSEIAGQYYIFRATFS